MDGKQLSFYGWRFRHARTFLEQVAAGFSTRRRSHVYAPFNRKWSYSMIDVLEQQAKTGDFFADTAAEIDGMTRTEALAKAESLSGEVSEGFCLGGVLKRINDNDWWKPDYNSFADYVWEVHGFRIRQAQYLAEAYTYLIDHKIPYETVKDLGWTKLRYLVCAQYLTAENAEELVARFKPLTVKGMRAELENELKCADKKTTQALKKVKSPETWNTISTPVTAHTQEETQTEVPEPEAPEELEDLPREKLIDLLRKMGEPEAVRLIKDAFPGSLFNPTLGKVKHF
jgi:hypothetical protein